MTFFQTLHYQRGATLVVGLIMLTLITIMVTTAFTLSSSNLKAVGNMQFRNEATAAANKAIEQIVSSNFTSAIADEVVNVDLNNDGTIDYLVKVLKPECRRATKAGDGVDSSNALPMTMSKASDWNTVWNIKASVVDAKTGAVVTVNSGIRALRSQPQKDVECA